MSEQPLVTKSRLVAELQHLGLLPGQTVMLHASVKNIGWIVGGPDMVLEAILDVLGEAGTLMMLASWEDQPVSSRGMDGGAAASLSGGCPAFNPSRSRAEWRKMSILAEYLRTWPGSRRSRHPFGVVAVGRRAEWLTQDEPWLYNNGPGSPLAKLCEIPGQVLLLGSPIANIALLHHAEHMANIPKKRIARYRIRC